MTTRKRGKSWGRWEGSNKKWIKTAENKDDEVEAFLPQPLCRLLGWFSQTWVHPGSSPPRGSFLSTCSSCSGPSCSGRDPWDRGAEHHLHSEQHGQEPALLSLYLQAGIFLPYSKSPVAWSLRLKSWGCILRVRCYPWKAVKPYRCLHKIRMS